MIEEFCDWLSATPLSVAFQTANWFVPSVQTVHIIAIAIFLISVYVISLKLVGLIRGAQPLAKTMARSTPWIWTALLVLLVTGILLTITEPARELLNWAFRLKMLMVLVLAGCVVLIQSRLSADPDYWTESAGRRWAARILGVLVLVIGACIVTAGRWIAYV
jgi:magnesium-transporting ATPase (P-type)